MAEIDTSKFEPNSHKYNNQKAAQLATQEARKVERVTTGTVKTRKRGLGKRFADIFLAEDVGDVKTYLIYDVILPALKENLADLVNAAIGMFLFGEANRRVGRPRGGNQTGSKVNYGGYFTNNQRTERMPNYQRSRVAHNFEDVVFETRGEAELVLDGMLEILGSECHQVTVADFYDLAGMSTNFTDNKYGWTDLRTARVNGSPSRGYWIDLPRCMALE